MRNVASRTRASLVTDALYDPPRSSASLLSLNPDLDFVLRNAEDAKRCDNPAGVLFEPACFTTTFKDDTGESTAAFVDTFMALAADVENVLVLILENMFLLLLELSLSNFQFRL